jgi:hypothetical protein
MNKPFFALLICTLILCCKNKNENAGEETSIFPALSFIKSQVAHIDTSVYRIIKIVKTPGNVDTSFLRREDFRKAAQDFLSLPDISSEDLRDDYTETKLYDEGLEQVVLNYMPKEKDAEIMRQEVMIQPHPDGDKVESLFISQIIDDARGTIQKILFWEVDKRFRVTTTIEKSGTSPRTETVEVIWNDFSQ